MSLSDNSTIKEEDIQNLTGDMSDYDTKIKFKSIIENLMKQDMNEQFIRLAIKKMEQAGIRTLLTKYKRILDRNLKIIEKKKKYFRPSTNEIYRIELQLITFYVNMIVKLAIKSASDILKNIESKSYEVQVYSKPYEIDSFREKVRDIYKLYKCITLDRNVRDLIYKQIDRKVRDLIYKQNFFILNKTICEILMGQYPYKPHILNPWIVNPHEDCFEEFQKNIERVSYPIEYALTHDCMSDNTGNADTGNDDNTQETMKDYYDKKNNKKNELEKSRRETTPIKNPTEQEQKIQEHLDNIDTIEMNFRFMLETMISYTDRNTDIEGINGVGTPTERENRAQEDVEEFLSTHISFANTLSDTNIIELQKFKTYGSNRAGPNEHVRIKKLTDELLKSKFGKDLETLYDERNLGLFGDSLVQKRNKGGRRRKTTYNRTKKKMPTKTRKLKYSKKKQSRCRKAHKN